MEGDPRTEYQKNLIFQTNKPNNGNRLKAPDKKPPRIIEEIIAKYAVDANLFRLGSTNPIKKNQAPGCFSVGGEVSTKFFIFF